MVSRGTSARRRMTVALGSGRGTIRLLGLNSAECFGGRIGRTLPRVDGARALHWGNVPPDLAMRMRGLEPPRGCPHTDLNRARLPIPPHPRGQTIVPGGQRALSGLGRRWQGRQASGRETVHKAYGERPRAQNPAASGVRRAAKPGFARQSPRGPDRLAVLAVVALF